MNKALTDGKELKTYSIKTKYLDQIKISEILHFKDQQWKFCLKSQKKFFKENTKLYDIHNLFYLKKKLIGYTALKKRRLKIKRTYEKHPLFDTLYNVIF
jgi:hypothetical protein